MKVSIRKKNPVFLLRLFFLMSRKKKLSQVTETKTQPQQEII